MRQPMKKRILISAMVIATALTTSLSASEYDLRANMLKLNAELSEVQRGIMNSDKLVTTTALESFSEDVSDLLSDEGMSFKKKIYNMFPKHKVTVAMKASRTMDTNIKKIQNALSDKNSGSMLSRQRAAQEAYQKIVGACFECHNLVRDK
jgi:hypothetical protein